MIVQLTTLRNLLLTMTSMAMVTALSGCSLAYMMASDIHDRKKMDTQIPKMQEYAQTLHQKAQRNELSPSEKLTYAHYIKNQAVNVFLPTNQRTNPDALQQAYSRYLGEAKDEGNKQALHEYINTLILSAFTRSDLKTPWSLQQMRLKSPEQFGTGLELALAEAKKDCDIFPLTRRYSFFGYREVEWATYPLKNFLNNPAASQYPKLRQDVEQLITHQQQHCPQTLNIHGSS